MASDPMWLIVLLMAIAAVTAGIFVASAARARGGVRRLARRDSEVLVAGNEYLAVVFKAYRKFSANMRRYGCIRMDAETIRQYMMRLPTIYPINEKAALEFQKYIEAARYSDAPMGEPARDAVISALRGVQYSLEKIVLTQEQLRILQETAQAYDAIEVDEPVISVAREPPLGRAEAPSVQVVKECWVICPPLKIQSIPATVPAGKHRLWTRRSPELIAARERENAELARKFGGKNVPPDFRMADDVVPSLRDLLAKEKYIRLAELLREQAGLMPKGVRVFIAPGMLDYLLEFGQRLSEVSGRSMPPDLRKHLAALEVAQVLALAEGRDYLIPDDLKLALIGGGDAIYGVRAGDVRLVLEEELRVIAAPEDNVEGRKPFSVEFILVGLPVPMV